MVVVDKGRKTREGAMLATTYALKDLSDSDLLLRLTCENQKGRLMLAEILRLLAEVDRRKLYLGQGFASLFSFATGALGLSEDEAAKRMHACRAARAYPVIFELVEKGELHLTAINMLAPHLTQDNHPTVLAAARKKSKRELELLVASLSPKPDIATRLWRLPAEPAGAVPAAQGEGPQPAGSGAPATTTATPGPLPTPSATPACEPKMEPPRASKGVVAPLSPERFRLQVTLSRAGRDALLRAQELCRRDNPSGELAVVLEKALCAYVEELERKQFAKLRRPTRSVEAEKANAPAAPACPSQHAPEHVAAVPEVDATRQPAAPPSQRGRDPAARRAKGSRRPPRAMGRAVFQRDDFQCTFVGPAGRCTEKSGLELHHIRPFARGGEHSMECLTVRCKAHNLAQAVLDFGEATVQARIEARRQRGRRTKAPPGP